MGTSVSICVVCLFDSLIGPILSNFLFSITMLLKSDTAYSAVTRPLNQMYWLVTKEVKGNTPCQAVSYKTHKLYFFFSKEVVSITH